MKRKWIMILLSLMVILFIALTACITARGSNVIARPGIYVSAVRGYVDNVEVETQLSGSRILSVRVTKHRETVGMGTLAVDIMPGRIVTAQSVAVDAVTGATLTANAIQAAVINALVEAGANMSEFSRPPPRLTPVDQTINVDVVVVGSGGAGLTAAIEAQNELVNLSGDESRRRNVLVIEKQDTPGGNSIRSLGAWYSGDYPSEGNQARINSGMAGGHWLSNRELLEYMIRNSNRVGEWLRANLLHTGGELIGGGVGGANSQLLIMGMRNRFQSRHGRLMMGVEATEILMSGNRAVGIRATDRSNGGTITINAGTVILATGGFGYNSEKISELNPAFTGFVSNNSPGALGDGIWMAEAVGAGLVHMEYIQSIPTVYMGNRHILEAPRNFGGILLNREGRRFVNDGDFRDVVSNAIIAQTGREAAVLFNQQLLLSVPVYRTDAMVLLDMGILKQYNTLEEVAAYIGCDPAVLRQTLRDWAAFVALPNGPNKRAQDPHANPGSWYTGTEDLSVGPWYSLFVQPGIHFTMGGVAIDLYTQVLAANGLSVTEIPGSNTNAAGQTFNRDGVRITGTPMPGLFAAGEVTGGIHGGTREGGNAMLENQLFGRVAGYNAARYVNNLAPAHPSGFVTR